MISTSYAPPHIKAHQQPADDQENKLILCRVLRLSLPPCEQLLPESSKEFLQETFLGTRLGENLQAMSSAKAFPEGRKWIECERGVGGKNSPICYIPEQDPVQDPSRRQKRPPTSS